MGYSLMTLMTLHDSSEFSHVLRLEKEKIHASTFELAKDPAFSFDTKEVPMEFDSADGFLATNDLIYLMSIVVT